MTTPTSTTHAPDIAVATPGTAPDPMATTWASVTKIVAMVGTVCIAMHIALPKLLTVGDVLALALLPVWFPVVRRYTSAGLLMAVGAFTIPFGAFLTLRSSTDHSTNLSYFVGATAWMIGVLACIGFLLWAREIVGTATLAVVFSVGLVLAIDPTSNLFSSNPWKFGFSVPVTVLALAWASKLGKRWLELTLAAVLTAVCFITDARSSFGVLLLTTALMAWQLWPRSASRTRSALRAFLGLTAIVVAVYQVGQALILAGAFGAATRLRTVAQLDQAGSLLVGGRPELLATINLIRDNPLGPGAGAEPNFHEVSVAKAGMAQINYDPNNGYVENWMFGNGYSLHSVFGDLWAQWGLAGLAFTAIVLLITIKRLTVAVSNGTASAVVLFLGCLTMWNVLFAPWFSSLRLLELLIALVVCQRSAARAPSDSPV